MTNLKYNEVIEKNIPENRWWTESTHNGIDINMGAREWRVPFLLA